jgi:peptidoglycan hydrolase CwlO-like protein
MVKGQFLKLYKQLIKEKYMGIEQVVNAVDIAANKLSHMESLYEQVNEQVDKIQYKNQQLENNLHTLNNEIASSKDLLTFYTTSCEHKR